jgi:dTDP-D-glucose 4,6-dehydratase
MKLLVTGGAGFIGSNYARQVLNGAYSGSAKYEVTVLDSLTYAGNPANLDPVRSNPKFSFVHGDILDQQMKFMVRSQKAHGMKNVHCFQTLHTPHQKQAAIFWFALTRAHTS